MFDDMFAYGEDRPETPSAMAWYEYGLKKGLMQKDPQSKWILDAEDRIICRNCHYIAPYDVKRGFCCGSYCANCGSKMEEFKR